MQTITDNHEHTVIEELDGLKVIKTIVKWEGKPGRDPHCLARIYVNQQKGTAIALLSALRSNFWNYSGVSLNMAMIASILIEILGKEIDILPNQIRWFIHYGPFSDFEANDGYTTIHEERLMWMGMHYEQGEELVRVVEDKFHERLKATGDDFLMEPVLDVVRQLGWRER
jgi:hypothetical protein